MPLCFAGDTKSLDGRTDRRRTNWSLCAAMLLRRHKKSGRTDRQTPDKVIPMCRYALQTTEKACTYFYKPSSNIQQVINGYVSQIGQLEVEFKHVNITDFNMSKKNFKLINRELDIKTDKMTSSIRSLWGDQYKILTSHTQFIQWSNGLRQGQNKKLLNKVRTDCKLYSKTFNTKVNQNDDVRQMDRQRDRWTTSFHRPEFLCNRANELHQTHHSVADTYCRV